MYKALEVEFIIGRKMLMVIKDDNRMRQSVIIKSKVLDLHGVIVLFEHE